MSSFQNYPKPKQTLYPSDHPHLLGLCCNANINSISGKNIDSVFSEEVKESDPEHAQFSVRTS